MPTTPETIAERINRTNRQLLTLAGAMSAVQFTHRPGPSAPSVQFHVFHVSRWSDVLQSWLSQVVPGREYRPQIWDRDKVGEAWGLSRFDLGVDRTGAGLADDDAAALPLPGRPATLAYSQVAFSVADEALAGLGQETFDLRATDWAGRDTTIGGAVLHHLVHINRHLGMIEALTGVYGGRGTATR